MSHNLILVLTLGGVTLLTLLALFRVLPRERWQMIAAVPRRKNNAAEWEGMNLTFYGLFTALGYALGVAVMILLMGSVGVSAAAALSVATISLMICIPATRIVARLVEGQKHTLTSGGAVFVGVVTYPLVIWLINETVGARFGYHIETVPMFAATAIGFLFGESVGRLSCISFGCCYGRRVCECSPRFQPLLRRISFVFTGELKKASYEAGNDGIALVPIQGITAVLYAIVGSVSAWLLLEAHYPAALMLALGFSQLWRFISEFIRADYRGETKISVYQVMSLFLLVGALVLTPLVPASDLPTPVALLGLKALWSPGVILFLQALWVVTFLYTGCSEVTASTIRFNVRTDRVTNRVVERDGLDVDQSDQGSLADPAVFARCAHATEA